MPKLILGSSSPRRLALLQDAGFVPDIVLAPDVDETPQKHELPHHYVARIAAMKFATVASLYPRDVVVACDTTVALGRRIIGKPTNAEEAQEILSTLSGRRHRVYSSVVVGTIEHHKQKTVMSMVQFKRLTLQEIAWYIATDNWQGKAGGYAISESAARFVKKINGQVSNIIGLPMLETANLLTMFYQL